MLLAPQRLCERVRMADASVVTLTWRAMLKALRGVGSSSTLTAHALQHLEAHVDRPTGIEHRTMDGFDHATTTIACLRQFLQGCIADIGGSRATGFNTTPGDGEPFRDGGWAWLGFSVPFFLADRKWRVGIYQYLEAPPGEESACATRWLEAYEGDERSPSVFMQFSPATLAVHELDALRATFVRLWRARAERVNDEARLE
jgi:hypothetical protein